MNIGRETVAAAKRDASRLLKQVKNNEPLDTELLKLVIRGYIGMLDFILSLASGSNGTSSASLQRNPESQ